MGMFDWVQCEVPLPDGWQPSNLQTKDLDCELSRILIRADGRLLIEDGDTEFVPAADRPHPDPSDPLHFIGSIKTINRRWRDLDYHGDLNFYSYEGDINGAYVWHEYTARFTDGKLVSIRCDSDQCGEAGETEGLDPKGASAGRTAASPKQGTDTPHD